MAQHQEELCEVRCDHADHEANIEQLKEAVKSTAGVAQLFKALADDTRVKIAYALAHSELCVCDVADVVGISDATASHHLRLLRNLGLAKYRREGKSIYYSLDDDHVVTLLAQALEHAQEKRG